MEIFFYFVLGYLGVIVLVFALSNFIRYQRVRFQYRQKYIVVQVRVSRENESGPIVAEQIFATLHGLQTKFSLWQKLRGYSTDHISFEIASVARVIKFYVAFPERLRNLVEGQIYAQYPDVEIQVCKDYAYSPPNQENALSAELKLTAGDVFPIKRYSQFEDKVNKVTVDPLAGITSALLRFQNPEDQAWVQVVVRPLDDKWRNVFTKYLKLSDRPFLSRALMTRLLWPKVVFFPFYLIFWIRALFVQTGEVIDGARNRDEVDEMSSMSSHERETPMSAAIDKVIRLLFEVNLRIVYLPKNKSTEQAKIKLQEVAGSFKQFNLPHLNGFAIKEYVDGRQGVTRYRKRVVKNPFVMSNEELATVYHLPNIHVRTPSIFWVESKKLEAPVNLPGSESEEGLENTVLGRTNFRGVQNTFGIKPADRRRHVYVVGKTGMGKSTLLENMIFSDIRSGKGVGVIDPHGDLAEAVLNFVPSNRTNDVMLIDPSDPEYAVAFNMLENVNPALNSIVCSGLVGIFKKIYADSWGPRLEHILRNTILSLLEYPGTTMLGIPRILQDHRFRSRIVKKIKDPVVKSFWVGEFNKMTDRFRTEAVSPIQNKVGQFLSSPVIRNIVGQVKSSVDLRFAMDKGKIVIINLSKGKIGEDNSALLGAMFITKFQLDAMSRANEPEKERKDFYLYVDEFQNFATESFATILSEARKYRLNLTMANQYIAQMPDEVRDAVFGNVGSILSFQVGFDDAEYLSQQFGEQVLPSDLVSLSKYNAYMKLLIDGMPTKTFSMVTLPPPEFEIEADRIAKVVKVSRERYGTKREVIEDKIKRWSDESESKKDEEGGDNKNAKNKSRGGEKKVDKKSEKNNSKKQSTNPKKK